MRSETGEQDRPSARASVLPPRLVVALLWTGLAAAAAPAPAGADPISGARHVQQATDTVPDDTLPKDTLPRDTTAVGRDTVPGGREPHFPEAFPVPDSGYSAVVWRCDRECLLDHTASNLLDLLESERPGAVSLRGSYYGGPHHLAAGLATSALTEVNVEELPLPELSGGQLDLTRVPLAWLSEVLVVRRAGELELHLVPVRHRSPEAYSRITVGSGEPNLSMIRGLFANGMGDHLAVSTGIDLLNTEGRLTGSDRLDFWGMASWMPGDGSGGAELLWRTQNVTRFAPESGAAGDEETPTDFRRRDAYLRGRGKLDEGVRIHVSAGRSEWRASRGDGGTVPGSGQGEGVRGPRVEAEGATFALQAERPWGFGRASFETWSGPSRPDVDARVAAGLSTGTGLRIDGAVRAGQWSGFSTRSYRAGLRWSPDLGAGLSFHAAGARGTRGVPRPWLGRADSLHFEEYRGGASLSLGSYRLSGLAALQDFSRQLPFSATFDRDVEPVRDAELVVGQGRVEGPIIPTEPLLGPDVAPIEIDLSYRRSRSRGPDPLLYVPLNLVRAQLRFRDQFFQDDLGVTLRVGTRFRSAMTSVDPSTGEAAAVSSRTTAEWSIVLRIVGARIWYRTENANRILRGNLAGQEFPPIRNSFGVKWEFTN